MKDVLFYYDIFFQKRIVITTFRTVYFCCFTMEEMDVSYVYYLLLFTQSIYILMIVLVLSVFLNFFLNEFFLRLNIIIFYFFLMNPPVYWPTRFSTIKNHQDACLLKVPKYLKPIKPKIIKIMKLDILIAWK